MAEEQPNAVVEILSALDSVPGPIRTGFFAATGRMLGSLAAFPAAWLRRPVQSFEDTTDARSIVAKGLAAALVDQLKDDPVTMQAVAEAYLPSAVRKVENRVAVAVIAAEEIGQSTDSGAKAAEPDDDWMNTFMRFAEDASSERLQSLFGKILAGEIINPGSFAPSTLRAVSELTQEIASDFEWAWARNFSAAMFQSDDFERGASWLRLSRLREAGLVSPNNAAFFQPEFQPVVDGLSPWLVGQSPCFLLVYMSKDAKNRIPMLPFTRIGNEIGKLLPPPNWEKNLRAVAEAIPKKGVSRIELHFGTKSTIIWTLPAEGQPARP